ncbi:MAG TPA: HlyD family efflux transporter periplasmic adaptor subunit [Azospirillaceae bacterium]|nr:HlyD family efflux transporter periplasmic adaptor subunit [Azospirillaceae bacterium]
MTRSLAPPEPSPQSTAPPPPPDASLLDRLRLAGRRLRAWARRWTALIIFAVFVGWISLVSELRVVALGAVDAEVTRIAPAFPSQISSVSATCDDRIEAGRVLAVMRNEIMVQQYRTDYARVEAELNQARNAYDARMAAAAEVARAAEHEHRAAVKVRENVGVLRDAMEPLWRRQQVTLTDWLEIDNNWLKALSAEAAAEATWRSRTADGERARLETRELIAGLEARLAELGKLMTLSGAHELTAVVSGVVTMCDRKAGEVIAAGEPVMEVQSDKAPTVLAYVGAADLPRIRAGMAALVYLAARPDPLPARVVALPVQVGRLPGRLKRYFWQGQEWQQYAPVRLAFEGPAQAGALDLRYNERVDVLFEMHPDLGIPIWLLNIF